MEHQHHEHDKHAGHSIEMFRNRFWVSLLLTIPVLLYSDSVQGWLNTFQTPFHREIEMTAQQRETFARYSAINMPMKVEDVPPELRF